MKYYLVLSTAVTYLAWPSVDCPTSIPWASELPREQTDSVGELEQTGRSGRPSLSPDPASYYLHKLDYTVTSLISGSSSSNGALRPVWPPTWGYGKDHPKGLWAKG